MAARVTGAHENELMSICLSPVVKVWFLSEGQNINVEGFTLSGWRGGFAGKVSGRGTRELTSRSNGVWLQATKCRLAPWRGTLCSLIMPRTTKRAHKLWSPLGFQLGLAVGCP